MTGGAFDITVKPLVDLYQHYQATNTLPSEAEVQGTLALVNYRQIQVLPFAASFDVALSDELVPGDVVFEGWDSGDFEVTDSKQWEGFTTYHYVRKGF